VARVASDRQSLLIITGISIIFSVCPRAGSRTGEPPSLAPLRINRPRLCHGLLIRRRVPETAPKWFWSMWKCGRYVSERRHSPDVPETWCKNFAAKDLLPLWFLFIGAPNGTPCRRRVAQLGESSQVVCLGMLELLSQLAALMRRSRL